MHPANPYAQRGRTLAIGFATAVSMWLIGYVAMMKPGLILGELLFALTLACLVAGGFMAGRFRYGGEPGWIAGAKTGITAALLNMLLMGSLTGGGGESTGQITLGIWVLGNLVASLALAAFGGSIGARFAASPSRPVNWLNRFTMVAAATVFLLLITGGLVTGLRAGLAVPDWPNSFGHNMLLYPLSEMVGGIYYEHAHRLYGMLVGLTAITVAVSMFIFDERPWMRALGVGYLLMVCIQGVLGGTRVTEASITLAIIHGMFGQIVFATIVAIAAFTSTTWRSEHQPRVKPPGRTDRVLVAILPLAFIAQLALGALYRHLRREWDSPPQPLIVLYTHILMAIAIVLLTIVVGGRAWGVYRDRPVLPAVGLTLLWLVGGQLPLGVAALVAVWSRPSGQPIPILEVIITTAHQATGALLLAASTLLMLWTRRLLAARGVAESHAAAPAQAAPPA